MGIKVLRLPEEYRKEATATGEPYEAGLRVPDDTVLVGCDDIGFAACAVVPLASVGRPATVMG